MVKVKIYDQAMQKYLLHPFLRPRYYHFLGDGFRPQ